MHPKANAYSATLGNFQALNIFILSFFGFFGESYGSKWELCWTVIRDTSISLYST